MPPSKAVNRPFISKHAHHNSATNIHRVPPKSHNEGVSKEPPETSNVPKAAVPSNGSIAQKLLENHVLCPKFEQQYEIGDELGSGGFGFVVTVCFPLISHMYLIILAYNFYLLL
jgi:hypothetical protein